MKSEERSLSPDVDRYNNDDRAASRDKSRSRDRKSRSRSPRRKKSYSRSRSRSGSRRRRRRSRSRSRDRRRSRSRSTDRRRRRRSRSNSRERRRYSRSRSRSPVRYSGRGRAFMGAGRGAQFGENPQPSRCIGVFGLSLYTNERDLRDFFGKYGHIEDVQLVYDHPTGRSRGFGFVYFEHLDDAIDAKEATAGTELDGHKIRVDFSMTKRAHTPTPGIYMGRPGARREGREGSPRRGSRSRSPRRRSNSGSPPARYR